MLIAEVFFFFKNSLHFYDVLVITTSHCSKVIYVSLFPRFSGCGFLILIVEPRITLWCQSNRRYHSCHVGSWYNMHVKNDILGLDLRTMGPTKVKIMECKSPYLSLTKFWSYQKETACQGGVFFLFFSFFFWVAGNEGSILVPLPYRKIENTILSTNMKDIYTRNTGYWKNGLASLSQPIKIRSCIQFNSEEVLPYWIRIIFYVSCYSWEKILP